jgi:DNA-binding GntR family transcriptional regulator
MDTSFLPVDAPRSPSAADRVYEYVKDGITARRFGPEELLAEGQLADAIGVSRTPVREGLLRLEAEGLVRLLPKRGVLVVPVTPAEVADVLETRQLIELHAIRKAVQAAPDAALLAALNERLAQMRAAMRARNTAAYVDSDRAFHAEIVQASGNEILTHLYSSLRDRQLRMGVANLLSTVDGRVDLARMRATLSELRAILDAITARSLRAGEAAVRRHLDGTQHLLSRSA